MTITIFEDHDCKGKSQVVRDDLRDLKGEPADKPGSSSLTSATEAVLLFRNDDWHGGALYIRGPKTVADLGKAKDGGRLRFGNAIRSIRITPFTFDLNVTVVCDGDGTLPGAWPSQTQAKRDIEAMVAGANAFYAANRALLELQIARITFRNSKAFFNLGGVENLIVPGGWKRSGEADVIFINRFTKKDRTGLGHPPCWGQAVLVGVSKTEQDGSVSVRSFDSISRTIVHELGHFLGLGHGTAGDDTNNVMFPNNDGTGLAGDVLTTDQVRELHDRLANNMARRGLPDQ